MRALMFGRAPASTSLSKASPDSPSKKRTQTEGPESAETFSAAVRARAAIAEPEPCERKTPIAAHVAARAAREVGRLTPEGYLMARPAPLLPCGRDRFSGRRSALPLDVLGRPRVARAARAEGCQRRSFGARAVRSRCHPRPARIRGRGERHRPRDRDRERAFNALRRGRRPRPRPLP